MADLETIQALEAAAKHLADFKETLKHNQTIADSLTRVLTAARWLAQEKQTLDERIEQMGTTITSLQDEVSKLTQANLELEQSRDTLEDISRKRLRRIEDLERQVNTGIGA